MKPLTTILATILLLLLLFVATPAIASPLVPSALMPDTYLDIVADFDLLKTFLSEVDSCDVYHVSRKGPIREKAEQYLTAGFDAALVNSILDAYTYTDASTGLLYIIPCDGFPLLGVDDWPWVTMSMEEDGLVLKRVYHDCYVPGDCFIYQVKARFQNQHWTIVDLALTESVTR